MMLQVGGNFRFGNFDNVSIQISGIGISYTRTVSTGIRLMVNLAESNTLQDPGSVGGARAKAAGF